MIEKLFSSRALYSTFAVFFDYPNDPLHPRLIARITGRNIKCVLRQLPRLEKCGVIVSQRRGKEKWYRLREEFPLFDEFSEIFRKTRSTRRYPGLQSPYDPLEILEDLMDEGD
jgi:hypothetical protein